MGPVIAPSPARVCTAARTEIVSAGNLKQCSCLTGFTSWIVDESKSCGIYAHGNELQSRRCEITSLDFGSIKGREAIECRFGVETKAFSRALRQLSQASKLGSSLPLYPLDLSSATQQPG